MNTSPSTPGYFAPWTPKELGLPKAASLALLIVAAIALLFMVGYTQTRPKPPPQAIQVTQAQPVTLSTPPPPPKIVPPPKPRPAIIPKPLPVPSRIVVATKPPPPVHHIFKPAPRRVVTHTPPPPVPVPHPALPEAAPAPPTSGIPVYGAAMHNLLEQNHNVPQALAVLGLSGTVVVQITVAPSGHVIAAKILHSSGNALIDKTGLQHAQDAVFAPFTANMPATPVTFTVPEDIEPDPNASAAADTDDQ